MGSLFKKFIYPLMRSETLDVQKLAVQFVGNWFPITRKNAYILGLEVLMSGCHHCKSLTESLETQTAFAQELLKFAEVC